MMCVHASMLPEQSQTYENREKIASISTFQLILSSIIAVFIPMMIQSMLEDPENVKWWQPSGQVILFYAPLMGIICATFGFILYSFTILSIDESFHDNASKIDEQKKKFKSTLKQMIVPATDKKFRKQLGVEFFNSMAGNLFGILIIPWMTYTLKFKSIEFLIYTITAILGKLIGYMVFKRMNKKKGLTKSYSACITICVIVSLINFVFLIDLPFEIKITLFIISIGTILAALYGFGLFSGPLASAIIVEAAAKGEGSNFDEAVSDISGAYFGLLSFLISCGPAFASFLLGLILTGPNKENPTIIAICFASMGFFYLASLFFMRQIKISKE